MMREPHIPLHIVTIHRVMGNDELGYVVLADEAEEHCITFTCEMAMAKAIEQRLTGDNALLYQLPDVMTELLPVERYMMTIVDVHHGQYTVVITDNQEPDIVLSRIRLSDALLFSLASGVPVCINSILFIKQCSPLQKNANVLNIPVNVLDDAYLKKTLQEAVNDENYQLADIIKREIDKRSNQNV